MARDFNHIQEWLDPLLEARGLSFERFANLCGLSRAIIYFYRNDTYRPEPETMAVMCSVLGVPVEEGMAQYTPKGRGVKTRGRGRR